jgi:hypothetical protein
MQPIPILTDDEIFEMNSLCKLSTGIDDILLYLLPNINGYRILVSNQPVQRNRSDINDLFTVLLPDKTIIGDINKSHITDEKLNKIFEFIDKNLDIMILHADYKIFTNELIDGLVIVTI